MKKIIFLITTIISLFAFFTISYAQDLNDLVPSLENGLNFEITGGISDKEIEATFDTYRTVTGIADQGTLVTIEVYYSEDEVVSLVTSQEIIVGKSGVFTADIDLQVGENIVIISAEYEEEFVLVEVTINRKSLDIKQELEEQNIIIPGLQIIKQKAQLR